MSQHFSPFRSVNLLALLTSTSNVRKENFHCSISQSRNVYKEITVKSSGSSFIRNHQEKTSFPRWPLLHVCNIILKVLDLLNAQILDLLCSPGQCGLRRSPGNRLHCSKLQHRLECAGSSLCVGLSILSQFLT